MRHMHTMTEAELEAIENQASYEDVQEAIASVVSLSHLNAEGRKQVRQFLWLRQIKGAAATRRRDPAFARKYAATLPQAAE